MIDEGSPGRREIWLAAVNNEIRLLTWRNADEVFIKSNMFLGSLNIGEEICALKTNIEVSRSNSGIPGEVGWCSADWISARKFDINLVKVISFSQIHDELNGIIERDYALKTLFCKN